MSAPKNTIQVSVKSAYGKVRVYPLCETAKLFAELTKATTFGERDIKAIKSLGYSVQQVAQERPDWL